MFAQGIGLGELAEELPGIVACHGMLGMIETGFAEIGIMGA
jgi:hypothetical protein